MNRHNKIMLPVALLLSGLGSFAMADPYPGFADPMEVNTEVVQLMEATRFFTKDKGLIVELASTAKAYEADWAVAAGEDTISSTSLNMSRGRFGLGVMHSLTEVAGQFDPVSVSSVYASYTVELFDLDNASLSFEVAHSLVDHIDDDDSVSAFRTRINYEF